MRKFAEAFFWIKVWGSHLIAFSILALCIALPFGFTGFLSGYVGWAVVLTMLLVDMDEETKEALKRWATKKNPMENTGVE